jgi:hypothetical protein
MTSFVAKWFGKKLIQDKILKERLENQFGVDVSISSFESHPILGESPRDEQAVTEIVTHLYRIPILNRSQRHGSTVLRTVNSRKFVKPSPLASPTTMRRSSTR